MHKSAHSLKHIPAAADSESLCCKRGLVRLHYVFSAIDWRLRRLRLLIRVKVVIVTVLLLLLLLRPAAASATASADDVKNGTHRVCTRCGVLHHL